MLIRFLLALAVILIISIPYAEKPITMHNSTRDKHMDNMSVLIDVRLVDYYRNHSGSLPENLDDNVLRVLGLRQNELLDDQGNFPYTYIKTSGNTFVISFVDSNNVIRQSPNSGQELPPVHISTY